MKTMIRTQDSHHRHKHLSELVLSEITELQLAHDALHVERVYHWCLRLAEQANCDADIAGACALVHDLIHIPKDHPDRPLGSKRSAQAAGSLLIAAQYSSSEIEAIVEAVRTCSWSRGLTASSELGKVLQEKAKKVQSGAVPNNSTMLEILKGE